MPEPIVSTEKADEAAAHTPEPWHILDESQIGFKPIIGNTAAKTGQPGAKYICDVRGPGKEWKSPSEEMAACANRIVLCVNACRGLSAEQVAAIPKLMEILAALSTVTEVDMVEQFAKRCESFARKLKVFEAMREALRMVIQQYTGDMADFVPEVCTALKLADDCEATP